MLGQAIAELDVEAAKRDVLPFVRDSSQLEVWSSAEGLKIIGEFRNLGIGELRD